ncbi:MAG: bifunctional lysylphosphatidylglycerol flippase/synthetase MprF [Pirellulales bacterium]|nr:bifunctional lysylphosphatidylglycerol flippase/synthetase MprF [Pirellulales bacterium]
MPQDASPPAADPALDRTPPDDSGAVATGGPSVVARFLKWAERHPRLLHVAGAVAITGVFLAALAVLRHELAHYNYRDIERSLAAIPRRNLLLALTLTVANYLVLGGYDYLGLTFLGRSLGYRRIALASFLTYASSHNFGALLGGTSMRYRIYSSWGLSALEIAKLVGFCGLTFSLGICTLGGVALGIGSPVVADAVALPAFDLQLVGAALLAAVIGYGAIAALGRVPKVVERQAVSLPKPRMAVAQIALSSLDMTLSASVLWCLLPEGSSLGFLGFLGLYVAAVVVGMLSHVPGGVGVFEAAMLKAFPDSTDHAALFGALVAFRAIYYLLPLGVAAVLLVVYEVSQRWHLLSAWGSRAGRWLPSITPSLLALLTLLAGAVLLISGATPADPDRLSWLARHVPLPLVELSHFAGSLVGVALVLLARGLQRRLDAAYHLTLGLLAAGIVFSLVKGFDYEEAAVLALALAAVWPARPYFYRRSSLFTQRMTASWLTTVALVVAGSMALAMFSFRHIEYRDELWWQFAFEADAPRVLRASVAVSVLAIVYGFARLLSPAPRRPELPGADELSRAAKIVAQSPRADAQLALLGDKLLLFDDEDRGLVMYQVAGRSWVSLGDPVAEPDEQAELVWEFHELVDRYGGWTVFYQVSEERLSQYLDLGLTLLKLGEEARVPLADFSLEGKQRRGLRHTRSKLAGAGCTFEVLPTAEVPAQLPRLREVSDAWLGEKQAREKGFSLGYFDEDYLRRFPCAVVRVDGQIVAFANVFETADKEELSLDLMRHLPDAPAGVMEFLFIELMLWGHERGYQWFSLGMAPLAGVESRSLAPLWNQVAALVYRHGERLYNFQGLRQYKDKFDPEWRPKYLASPGGWALGPVLADLVTLIAGGWTGVIKK